jgi:hypothetical protein
LLDKPQRPASDSCGFPTCRDTLDGGFNARIRAGGHHTGQHSPGVSQIIPGNTEPIPDNT